MAGVGCDDVEGERNMLEWLRAQNGAVARWRADEL